MALITHTTNTTSGATTATGSIQVIVDIVGNAKCQLQIDADSIGYQTIWETTRSDAKVVTLSAGTNYKFNTLHSGTSTVKISHNAV
jgi:hypothetical protein